MGTLVSQTYHTPDKANAETDEGNDDEHEDKRVAGDSIHIALDPANSRSHKRCNITNNARDRRRSPTACPITSLLSNMHHPPHQGP